MRKRVEGIIITIELLVMIMLPLVTFNWTQGKISAAENRKLCAFPTLFDSNGELKEYLLEDFSAWFQDNIGLRDYLINLSSIISFNVFHTSTSEKVEIGKDGWLFYTAENNLDIVNNTYPDFDEEQMEDYCQKLMEVQTRLNEQDREFVFAIPPSKVSIYPEYIQSGDFELQQTPADLFADYLEAHSDIKVVRFKDALLKAKRESNEELYYKTDTHWNLYGGYTGYKKLIDDFNSWGLIDSDPIEAEFYEDGPYSGDLASVMGVVNFKGDKFSESIIQNISLIDSQVAEVTSGDKYDAFMALKEAEGISKNCTIWENTAIEEAPRLLVYGDSMIGSRIINYIAENFSETTFVWSYTLNQEMIDLIDPDIVMLDISEREMSAVFPGLFDRFLRTDFSLDKENKTLDIYYYDQGELESMYFPVWSVENGQDDLIWYQAERINDNCWYAQADLGKHGSGRYEIHFYDGPCGLGKYVNETLYDVGSVN